MIRIDIISIFPEIFDPFIKTSLIDRAQKKGLLQIKLHNLRDWTEDNHQTVDDRPYGGGIGMVMKVEPIFRAVKDIKKAKRTKKRKVILFSPRGRKFNQKTAHSLSRLNHIVMLCGRYEGVDERVAKKIADMELSIGDYVLMGGELPAMVVTESLARLIPGVLGKPVFLKERVTRKKGFVEYPQYTRPEVFQAGRGKKWKVPEVLISGDHKKIQEWREKHSKIIGS